MTHSTLLEYPGGVLNEMELDHDCSSEVSVVLATLVENEASNEEVASKTAGTPTLTSYAAWMHVRAATAAIVSQGKISRRKQRE
jgi:hypothetical protein